MSQPSHDFRFLFPVFLYTFFLALFLGFIYFSPTPYRNQFFPPQNNDQLNLIGSIPLITFMKQQNGYLSNVLNGEGAPNINLHGLPQDIENLEPAKRIDLFISIILSHSLKSNLVILQDRRSLIRYMWDISLGIPITESRKQWYLALAEKYHVSGKSPQDLLNRVDVIPISLTIAQAIMESGWGTSRFAQQGNSLYGQHLPRNSKGKYITSRYGNVKVAAFDSILEATQSYAFNLNSSIAYRKLRRLRAEQRSLGVFPTGIELAKGLHRYSEIGYEYVEDIQYIIRKYKLDKLEEARLKSSSPELQIVFQKTGH